MPVPAAKDPVFRNALALASSSAPEDKSSKATETRKKDTVLPDSAAMATQAPVETPVLPMPVPEPKIALADLPVTVVSKDSTEGDSSTSGTSLPAARSDAQAGGVQTPTSSAGTVATDNATLVDGASTLFDTGAVNRAPETAASSPSLPSAPSVLRTDVAVPATPQRPDATPHTKVVDAISARADSHMPSAIQPRSTTATAQTRQDTDPAPPAPATRQSEAPVTVPGTLEARSKESTDGRNQSSSEGSTAHAKTDAATPSQPTDPPVTVPARTDPSLQALLPSSLQSFPLAQVDQNPSTGANISTGADANTMGGARQIEARPGAPAPKSKAGSFDARNTSVTSGKDANAPDAVTGSLPAGHPANLLTGEQTPMTPKSAPNEGAMQQIAQAGGQVAGSTQSPQPSDAAQPAAARPEAGLPLPLPESHVAPSITGAQLIQSMQHSEMRVGMQSAEFGNISISTSLNHQALSAQISIDHSELGRALAVHMPAIEEKLSSASGLQARVEVRDTGNGSAYSNAGQQSRQDRQNQGGRTAGPEVSGLAGISVPASSSPVPASAVSSRLDIRI